MGRSVRLVLAISIAALPALAILGLGFEGDGLMERRVLLLLACGIAAGLAIPRPGAAPLSRAALGVLISASIYLLGQGALEWTDYPFSLAWSEGNHLWAGSLYVGTPRYEVIGDPSIPSYISSGFYALAGLPFVVPGIGIRWLRLWNELLLLIPPLAFAGLAFSKDRLRIGGLERWILIFWGSLFVLQGPAYAPLVLAAIASLVALDRLPSPARTAVIALSTFYLGISRWFWLVAPLMWSATWQLLDGGGNRSPRAGLDRIRQSARLAAAWLLGGAASIVWVMAVEGRLPFTYLGSLRHPMLWYRWMPNATSPYGIVPWIAVTAAPAAGLLFWAARRGSLGWTRLQLLGIALLGAIQLGIGLLVSVKIGGGDNLHNLDMFLVYLVLVAALALRSLKPAPGADYRSWPALAGFVLLVAILLPAAQVMHTGSRPVRPEDQAVSESLAALQDQVATAAARGPVLFIDQRQLLAFGQVDAVPLLMEYELVELMDRALGSDSAYLDRFRADLEARRFSLIVSDPLPIVWRGRTYPFGEENDAWVRHVAIPILSWYQPVLKLDAVGVWLLAPIEGASARIRHPPPATHGPW